MAASEEEYEHRAVYEQRLKAAVHYTVGQICQEVAGQDDVAFTKQFTAVLAEATFKCCQHMASDLEQFAKHAKRATISADDVKLFVRKSPSLWQHISSMSDQQTAINEGKKNKTKRKPKQKASSTEAGTNNTNLDMQEDSNL